MNAITPELLMRYADGEVSLPERHRIEKHLAADSGARDLLTTFQTQSALLPAAFAEAADETIPAQFEHTIDQALEQRQYQRRQADLCRWVFPIAASLLITLAGGLFAAHYADQRIQIETAQILAEQAVAKAETRELALQTRIEALEHIVSGDSLAWADEATGTNGKITPLRTYQGPAGQWCREYQETTQSATSADQVFSIACRTPSGLWRGHGIELDPHQL